MTTPREILNRIKEISFPIHKPEYAFVIDKGYKKLEHRVVWEKNNGKIPVGFEIHHINGNRFDNRIENLQCLYWREHRKIHRKN